MDRAQIHTLEAFLAALLIVGALLFASQATAVTPLSASTANQHIETQQEVMAEDLLSHTARDGSLQEGLRYWNVTNGTFAETPPGQSTYSRLTGTEHPWESAFSEVFPDGVYAYNVDVVFTDAAGDRSSTGVVSMGTPSDNAVTAVRTVTLFESDTITSPDSNAELGTLSDGNFWAPNTSDSAVYNVVEVRVTVWRM